MHVDARASGATALLLDDAYVATARLAGGCGTQASKARRRRDVFHARVISDWGEDADEDFFENNSEEFVCTLFVNT